MLVKLHCLSLVVYRTCSILINTLTLSNCAKLISAERYVLKELPEFDQHLHVVQFGVFMYELDCNQNPDFLQLC